MSNEQEIQNLRQKDDRLLERQIKTMEDLAKLSVKQEVLADAVNKMENNITETIEKGNTRIHERIDRIAELTEEHQKVQQSIVEIQKRQGEQINDINSTLKEFTQIQKTVNQHEDRINSLEEYRKQREESEKAIKQENTKGK